MATNYLPTYQAQRIGDRIHITANGQPVKRLGGARVNGARAVLVHVQAEGKPARYLTRGTVRAAEVEAHRYLTQTEIRTRFGVVDVVPAFAAVVVPVEG